MSDDWGDIEYNDTRMGRRAAGAGPGGGKRSGGGLGREERFIITLAAAAALMLIIGVAIGFALGRASAPKAPSAPVAVATTTPEPTATPVAETTVSAEVSVPVEPPVTPPVVEVTPTAEPLKAPNQISPDYGAKIKADKVTLKWSKVTGAVTYAFEIQTRVNGKWTNGQVIDGLKSTSYSARVLTSLRRWRVWAIDENGKAGAKSDWSTYSHTAVKVSTPSTTTTGTAH